MEEGDTQDSFLLFLQPFARSILEAIESVAELQSQMELKRQQRLEIMRLYEETSDMIAM